MKTQQSKRYPKCLEAVLAIDITYFKNEIEVEVKAGTNILIDISNDIALIEGDHVDIEKHEYFLIS